MALECQDNILQNINGYGSNIELVWMQMMTDNPTAACIGNDPMCPCQDGDACHYRDIPGSAGWSIPAIEHWTVHYREWVATRPDIAKLGLIEQMEAYVLNFPEKAT